MSVRLVLGNTYSQHLLLSEISETPDFFEKNVYEEPVPSFEDVSISDLKKERKKESLGHTL